MVLWLENATEFQLAPCFPNNHPGGCVLEPPGPGRHDSECEEEKKDVRSWYRLVCIKREDLRIAFEKKNQIDWK